MTRLLTVLLLLSSFFATLAYAESRSWKCTSQYAAGVSVGFGYDIRPTVFSDRPEFRILSERALREHFRGTNYISNIDEEVERHPDADAHAFVRDVRHDPSHWSWRHCSISVYDAEQARPEYELRAHSGASVYACEPLIFEVWFNSNTRRFTATQTTSWVRGDDDMFFGGPPTDGMFAFGTCSPYYD